MSDPSVNAALCLLIACSPAIGEVPTRGCILLNPVQPNTVQAQDLSTKDLCTQDGKVISYVNTSGSRVWEANVIPPYNRVTMTLKGQAEETTVTLRTPNSQYEVLIKP